MRSNPFIKNLYIVLFHLTLAFLLFDWVLPLPRLGGILGFYEFFYLLLAVSFLVIVINARKEMIPLLKEIIKSNYVLLTVFTLYLIMGVITVFYAQSPTYVIPRYFVAVQMAGFLLFGLLYVFYISDHPQTAVSTILRNIGISAWLIAVYALIGYELGITPYTDKISPYPDYNQYAILLLFGYVSLLVPILFSEFMQKKNIASLLLPRRLPQYAMATLLPQLL